MNTHASTSSLEPGLDDQEDELLDLRYVSEHQIACSGIDLKDMLNYDDAVDLKLYARLHLTSHIVQASGFEYTEFDEISDDAFYMITFPEGTDFSDFSIAQALTVEEISEKCFNGLPTGSEDEPCDGNCEDCPQECIGKQPVNSL